MSVTIADFWKLAVQSRLLTADDCRQLDAAFAHVKGASNQGNAVAMGEWLVAQGAFSRYQVQTLLAGRPGPFIFGDYSIYDRIRSKEGRLGGLFRAMHVGSRHPVLLYFLEPEIGKSPEPWQAAVHQIAWACWVGHPYVCECHHLLDLGKYKLVAIENLTGETAAARLAAGIRFALHDACRLVYEAALGLARLHQLGLVHGEIRPENFWLTPEANLKLLQVPLAPAPLRGPAPLDWANPTTKLLAAADYAAPELAQPGRPPDALTDIYALGATLFQLLSGTPPFAGSDLRVKVARHAAEPVGSLAAIGVPAQLDQMIAYMMAKDPSERYQQAAQVAESLAYFVDPAAISAAPPVAASLPAYDQWLQQRSRVPGAEPGTIPTGLQLAAYTAAQHAAADQTARHAGAAHANPAQAGKQSFGSSAEPAADPSAFVPAESSRQESELGEFDFSPRRDTSADELLESLSSPRPSAATLNDLEAVLDTDPRPVRRKPVAVRKRASRRRDLIAIVVTGVAIAIAVMTGLIIVRSLKHPRDEDDGNLAVNTDLNTPHTDRLTNPSTTGTTGMQSSTTSGTGVTATGTTSKTTTKGGGPGPANAATAGPTPDDGKSLWASPTSGQPLSLDYFPSGAQIVLAIRTANIVRRAEGELVLPALGPWGTGAAQFLKGLTGLELNQIDQVTVVWRDPGDGPLAPTVIIRTPAKMAADTLLAGWGNPTAAKEGDEVYYPGPTSSYYLPSKEAGNVLVVSQAVSIKEIIQSAEGRAMAAPLERILKEADADRDVNLAFIPGTLFSDNQAFFVGELTALQKPAEAFFGDEVKAALLSLHFGGNFFVELRALGTADKPPDTLASQFAGRAVSLPGMVENSLVDLNLHRYDKKLLLLHYPGQLRLLAENIRSDADGDMALLRCYLPSVATHNLLLETELALAEAPRPATSAAASTGNKTQAIAELLQKKTTLTFPRDTLEKSLENLFRDVGINYEILGTDLQLEGITKNQSFGLDEQDKPAGEILRKIMILANPDGKLVYVVKPKQPGGPEMLFITTRSAAAKRKDTLPPELAAAPTKSPPGKAPPKKKP
jgi:serine/threonine protein kinase